MPSLPDVFDVDSAAFRDVHHIVVDASVHCSIFVLWGCSVLSDRFRRAQKAAGELGVSRWGGVGGEAGGRGSKGGETPRKSDFQFRRTPTSTAIGMRTDSNCSIQSMNLLPDSDSRLRRNNYNIQRGLPKKNNPCLHEYIRDFSLP